MPEFIYTMKGLGKVHPPDAKVLEDIWLSFYFGAKIGVLGLNGAGKSSLLKIMAGEDTRFLGEAFPAAGISVGFLQQEPRLDPSKTVLGNVEEGVAEIRALLTRYDEINARFGEDLSPDEMDKVLAEQGRVQDQIEAANGWDLDSRLELRWKRSGCRHPTRTSRPCQAANAVVSHCAGCCCDPLTCCCWTSRPITSMPSRSRGSSGS
jgi:sulfate-transporting ATPase